MNVAAITGYVVSDIELKNTNGGISVCSFTVAVKRPNVKDQTDYIDCVAWRERAEFICKYFQKGSKIEVNGHFETRIAAMKDNTKRKFTELYCENVGFGDRKSKEDGEAPSEPEKAPQVQQTAQPKFDVVQEEENLPF